MSTTICPYLGGIEDRGTCFSFPSPSNCCWRLRSPAEIGPEQQTGFCLAPNFTQCPVYTSGQSVPGIILRKSAQLTPPRPPLNWRLWLLIAEVFVIITIIVVVLSTEFFVPLNELVFALPTIASTQTPRPPATATRTLVSTLRPTVVIPTATFIPTVTPTSAPTVTAVPPSPTPGPNASDPVGTLQLFSYAVQRNDTLAILATRYKIKVNAIVNVNGLDRRAQLQVGQSLIIPAAAGDAENLPRISIYQISTDSSLTTLAQQLNVEVENVRQLNALGPDDFIPAGRLLYVPAAPATIIGTRPP